MVKRMWRRLVTSTVAALACGAAAWADPGAADGLTDADALYAAGAFDRAEALAAAREDADGYALAAKAAAAAFLLNPSGRSATEAARRVRGYAEAALAREPHHVEARLHMAVALWLEGRDAGALESYLRNLPGQGRDVLRAALTDAPEDAWAHALMGAWHLEVLRRGGGRGARLYGAGLHEGVDHFYHAMRLEPDNAAIAFQCAVSFLALDPERYAEHAGAALEVAQSAEADDAFEAEMIRRSRELLALMARDEDERVRRQVARWTEG